MTGIVGVNRDVLGAGLGFQCIFNTDVFCVASPFHSGDIPPRLLHPKRVLRGVHSGVRDGGNQSGIPDLNGAIVFHERFLGKPLVFCGTGGISPAVVGKPAHEGGPARRPHRHDRRPHRQGRHPRRHISEPFHEGSLATAVQIGDPITQKKMADFLLEARDLAFSTASLTTARGLSSSIGEMADTGRCVRSPRQGAVKICRSRPVGNIPVRSAGTNDPGRAAGIAGCVHGPGATPRG